MTAISPPTSLSARLLEITQKIGPLGFIAFGGPQVHVVLFRKLFVLSKEPWLDPLTFADLFALSGSLPGPGSTQLLFSIGLIRGGGWAGILAFFFWSLPGAVGMFCLALAVKHIPPSLPPLVLALLTGLNAAAVGLIFLAAYKLAQLTAVDAVTRIVLFSSAAIGTCYISPWLFPVLTVSGGIVTFIWDLNQVQNAVRKSQAGIKNFRKSPRQLEELVDEGSKEPSKTRGDAFSLKESPLPGPNAQEIQSPSHADGGRGSPNNHDQGNYEPTASTSRPAETSTLHRRQYPTIERSAPEDTPPAPAQPQTITPINFSLSLTQSLLLVGALVSVLVTLLVLQATLRTTSRELKLVTNLFVGGTILFGGGPVVIPLLQGYIVTPGWVSTKDFLFGFAILQAFPGPNFNFAVFLGALSIPDNPVLGGILGFIAFFFPGLILKFALVPFYRTFRDKKQTRSALRGLNSAASGLVWTSIFRLWKVGLLTANSRTKSLETSGYWVSIAGAAFAASEWFSVQPPVAIIGGAIAGLIYGAVKGSP